jgi:tetratricopeptide (TPR) repeat protein
MRFVLEFTPSLRIQVGKIWHELASDKSSALLLYVAAHPDGVTRINLASLFWGDHLDKQARSNLRQVLMRLRSKPYGASLVEEKTMLRFKGQVQGNLANCTFILPDAPDFMVWLEAQKNLVPRFFVTQRLPENLTSFVGRDLELQTLNGLLSDPTQRLISVIGMGGMGKTRLCIQVLRGKKTVFVRLAGLPDHGFALAVLQALGLSPSSHLEPKNQVLSALRDWQGVLLLDNFESVLTKGNTLFLSQILEQSSGVQCLISSREALQLYGETVFALHGLEQPKALVLFAGRVQILDSTWQLEQQKPEDLTALLHFTNGIPLALELVASWLPKHSLSEALAWLERGDTKQIPNLHLILETTWQRLGVAERQTLIRFSTFRGGARLDSVKIVTQTSLGTLYKLMPSLIHKTDQGRYTMHEVLRQFAEQQAFDSTALEHHAAHFKQLLLSLEPVLKSSGQIQGAQRFLEDLDNFRAMWQFFVQRSENHHALLEMRDVFFRCWQLIGLAREGATYFSALEQQNLSFKVRAAALLSQANLHQMAIDHLTTVLNANLPDQEKGIAFTVLAESEFRIGQHQNAKDHVEKALGYELEPNWKATLLDIQGFLAADVDGNEKLGNELMRQSLLLRRQIYDQRGIAKSLISLGVSEYLELAFERAKNHWLEALEIMQAFGDPIGQGRCLSNLGMVYQDLQQPEQAQAALEQALNLRRGVGDQSGAAQALLNLGLLHSEQQNPTQALQALQESLVLRQQLGEQRAIIGCQIALSDLRLYPALPQAEQPPLSRV